MITSLIEDPNLIGNKAANLSKFRGLLNIPKSLVITTEAFREYIKDKSFLDKLVEYLDDSLSDFKRPLIFRSSSTVEDTPEKSYAGVFKSVLNVYTKEDMKEAIKEIYEDFLRKSREDIAILVQEQFTKGKFGVMFGFDDKIVLEVTLNDPTGITSGRAKIKDLYIIDGENAYVYNNKNWKILFDLEIEKIKEADGKIKNVIYPYDVEFVVYKGDFYLLQVRPLHKKPEFRIGTSNLYGVGVSSGKVMGRVSFSEDNKGVDKILVIDEVPFDEIEKVKEFGGIIIEIGSLLSHIAIHMREYGIPAIVGVPIKYFREGELIEMDGSTGEIKFLDRRGFEISRIEREIEIYDPKMLRLLIVDKYAFVLYPKDGYSILFYRDSRGLDYVLRISEDPLVDGGVDSWHTYVTILELSLLDSEVRGDFERVIKAIEEANMEKIEKLYGELKNKISRYYREAEMKEDLYLVEKTYAYIRLVRNVLLFEYGQKLMNNPKFMELVKKDEGERLPELYKIYELFDKLYDRIEKEHGLKKMDYTSYLAFQIDILKKESKV
ncbi:MAG: hypothetical protein BXU00_02330 [Candidatus Nanoclepta minutus]|uniref:Pyruvate, water dikinase n=1 Tax=Candidatus Nanoclepta minutus TaxID=1940235 RepID=A0A397WMP8_9ARCH|nr:MAG: hypothetical protein BXU00_02330 [Candidatus Nanoclepta minutus]